MSKFKECLSYISHWKNGKKIVQLETSLYIFAESQSTGSHTWYDHTIWSWQGKDIKIEEVGIHPNE